LSNNFPLKHLNWECMDPNQEFANPLKFEVKISNQKFSAVLKENHKIAEYQKKIEISSPRIGISLKSRSNRFYSCSFIIYGWDYWELRFMDKIWQLNLILLLFKFTLKSWSKFMVLINLGNLFCCFILALVLRKK